MNRNTFGNVYVAVFAILLLPLFTRHERYHRGANAPTATVVLPALYKTAFTMGGVVCVMLIGLRLAKPRR